MTGGSQQLRLFRRAIRDGATIEAAADLAGMTIGEARLHHADDLNNPPPPEAFELLRDPDAPVAASTQAKDDDMARGRMARASDDDHEGGEGGGITGEYKRPDAKGALKIYQDEIAPKQAHMATIKGDLSDPYKRIKDTCFFPRKILDFLVQLADMEEAKRDHFLLALNLGLQELNIALPTDLVTLAEGKEAGPVIPAAKRAKPKLVTVPLAPSDDSDLGDPTGVEPQSGTGAAAIAAMRADHAKDKAEEDAAKAEADA